MTSYIFSIINDFRDMTPKLSELNDSITSSSIVSNLDLSYNSGDDIVFVFTPALSAPDEIILNNIVDSYIPELKKRITLTSRNNEITNNSFKRISNGIFPGATYATASAICYMDSTATSYDIMIFDKTNKQILLSKNLNNTVESIQDLGALANIPSSTSDIEISAKRNGGNSKTVIHIESVTIFYK